jgi:hypothetical protein
MKRRPRGSFIQFFNKVQGRKNPIRKQNGVHHNPISKKPLGRAERKNGRNFQNLKKSPNLQ